MIEASDGRTWAPASRSYVLAVLLLASVISIVDRQIITVLLVPIKRDLGLSDTAVGLMTGLLFSIFYILAGFPLGRLADRGTRRTIIAGCMVAWSLATMLSGVASSFLQLALTRMMVAIGEAGCAPASTSIIADLYPSERRPRIFSFLYASAAVGIAGGIFLGGTLGEAYGWRTTFVIIGAPGLLLALLIRLTVPEPLRAPGHAQAVAASTLVRGLRGFFRMTSFRAIALIAVAASSTVFGVIAWMPTLLIRLHGMSTAELGWKLGGATATGLLVGNLVCGLATEKLIHRDVRWLFWLPAAGLLCSLPAGLSAAFASSGDVSVMLTCLFMALSGFWTPPIITALVGLVSSHSRALASATLPLFTSLGGALGPAAVGLMNDHLFAAEGVAAVRHSMALVLIGSAFAALVAIVASRHLASEYRPE